jgi:hypothetical protein
VALLPAGSCVAGTLGLQLNPQLRRIAAEMPSAKIAMSGSYFDDLLRDPRRYGIENTTDKLRRPGGVRRKRDAVCTESTVGHPEVGLGSSREVASHHQEPEKYPPGMRHSTKLFSA